MKKSLLLLPALLSCIVISGILNSCKTESSSNDLIHYDTMSRGLKHQVSTSPTPVPAVINMRAEKTGHDPEEKFYPGDSLTVISSLAVLFERPQLDSDTTRLHFLETLVVVKDLVEKQERVSVADSYTDLLVNWVHVRYRSRNGYILSNWVQQYNYKVIREDINHAWSPLWEYHTFRAGDSIAICAPEGTTFYSKKNFQQRVGTIPGLQKLKVAENPSYEPVSYIDPVSSDTVIGYWLKVKYQQRTGYVLASYVFSSLFNEHVQAGPAHLLIEGSSFQHSMQRKFKPGFHYYGVYQNNGRSSIRAIQLSFYTTLVKNSGERDRLEAYDFNRTNREQGAVFIVGLPTPLLDTGGVEGYFLNEREGLTLQVDENNEQQMQIGVPASSRLPHAGITASLQQSADGKITLKFTDEQGKFAVAEWPAGECTILWMGDIDNDSRQDYYVSAGYVHFALLLSSLLDKNNRYTYIPVYELPMD